MERFPGKSEKNHNKRIKVNYVRILVLNGPNSLICGLGIMRLQVAIQGEVLPKVLDALTRLERVG